MATKKKETGTFEESLRRLEQIVSQLEGGEIPLDEAMVLYEEGITLSRRCSEQLNQAEVVLKRLGKDMEGNLKLFDGEEKE